MANQYINAMTDLWNSSGTTYASIKMNVTNAASAVASKLFQLQIGSVDKFTVDKTGNVVAAGTVTGSGVVSSGGALPSANDAAALGASGTAWSDLFLASGGVINWNAGDVTVTNATDQLIFSGAASGYSFSNAVSPTANDGAALGISGTAWSDLFLATGAVVNYGAGNWVSAHSDGAVTVTTGDFRIATAGTNSASAVTVGGIQTLTGKTLSSPTLNTATTVSPTISGAPTAGGATWTNLGAVTTCDINGGTIDGTTIGATTPAAITASTITATTSNSTNVNASGTVAAPTGSFASSVYGGSVNTGNIVQSLATNIIIAPAAGLNTIFFRPRGYADGTGQVYIDNAGGIVTGGSISASGNIYAGGTISAASHFDSGQDFVSVSGNAVLASQGGAVFLRPNGAGNGAGQVYVDNAGQFVVRPSSNSNGVNSQGKTNSAGGLFYAENGAYYIQCGYHQSGVRFWGAIAQGAIGATEGFITSDANFKENIVEHDCAAAHSAVMAIGIKTYRKKIAYATEETGWLAQDVEKIMPHAVLDVPMTDPENPDTPGEIRKFTNDHTMLGTLWAAVQHQNGMIERLEAKLKLLERGSKNG